MQKLRTVVAVQAALVWGLSVAACSGDDGSGEKGSGSRDVSVSPGAGGSGTTVGSHAGSGVPTGAPTVTNPPAAIGGGAGNPSSVPSPGTNPSTTPPPPATPPGASAGRGATPPPTTPGTPPPAAMPGPVPWNTSGKTCLQAGSGKFGEPGPYKVARKEIDLGMISANQNSGAFTIFYPNPLEGECLHPIVAWGNGTGVGDAETYAFFNNNAASWGMVVIASHESNTGSGAFHKAGIDYMLKQNDDPMSPFYKKLSTRVGTSGHSQGAGGAVAGASHPNVSVNVGVGGPATTSAKYASLCLTGTEDIASTSCPALPDRAQGPMFAASWQGGDHVKTETVAGYITKDAGTMAMQRLYAAWFRCYLADDGVACNLFKGATPDQCGVCKEGMGWAVLKSKNIQ